MTVDMGPCQGLKTTGLEAGLVSSSYPAEIFTGSVKVVSLGAMDSQDQ